MIKVLFVCLGNICRSPLAEGIFTNLVLKRGLNAYVCCDSAATASFHIGESPDIRMQQTSLNHGVTLKHKARKLVAHDFTKFDYILAMDKSNLADILTLYGVHQQEQIEIRLLRDFDEYKDSLNVPDPYFGDARGFEEVYEIVSRCCEQFLTFLNKEHTFSQ